MGNYCAAFWSKQNKTVWMANLRELGITILYDQEQMRDTAPTGEELCE